MITSRTPLKIINANLNIESTIKRELLLYNTQLNVLEENVQVQLQDFYLTTENTLSLLSVSNITLQLQEILSSEKPTLKEKLEEAALNKTKLSGAYGSQEQDWEIENN